MPTLNPNDKPRCPLRIAGVLAICLLSAGSARASGPVTNCTQAALEAALAGGGSVTFTQDCSLTLTNTINITANVSLDAGGKTVTISGNNVIRLFTVASGVRFTNIGLTFSGGRETNRSEEHTSELQSHSFIS